MMLKKRYSGSVKDIYGPLTVIKLNRIGKFSGDSVTSPGNPGISGASGEADTQVKAVLFHYTDAFSVFDWGKMPDLLPGKGKALAYFGAKIFEELSDPSLWQSLRKERAFTFVDCIESELNPVLAKQLLDRYCAKGLSTHYLGFPTFCLHKDEHPETTLKKDAITSAQNDPISQPIEVRPLSQATLDREWLAEFAEVNPPQFLNGKFHYPKTVGSAQRGDGLEFLSVEVVFRLGLTAGSSYLERHPEAHPGQVFSVPKIEYFTKLEPSDRWLSPVEAAEIVGGNELIENLGAATALVSAFLQHRFRQIDIDLIDGKLEWAWRNTQKDSHPAHAGASGELVLVDAIGPDELRLLPRSNLVASAVASTLPLSKDFLRVFYRQTNWFDLWKSEKKAALAAGPAAMQALKKRPDLQPPLLPQEWKTCGAMLYPSLVNRWEGREVFSRIVPLEELLEKMQSLLKKMEVSKS